MQIINIIESRNGIIDNVESFIILHDLMKIAVEQPKLLKLLNECRNLNQEVVKKAENRFVELAEKEGFGSDMDEDMDEFEQAQIWSDDNKTGYNITLVWSYKVN